ncbi:hypothetical protein AA103196_0580 [Ameyamaea chiangmaiensis NBRC 103196]|uniref:Glycosyltransferase family 9 protein n=1 Tax=Ameyamaea chiangmaiensis TaxID=442969 RepID=A0A850P7S1_9PROT|nr:glycosyltransferase family 9 protein [Ameyamaea chiangmaiensis]MBS4076409.1 glycosyltransferase family 9 protein [Ameyamaea chiangmaiensis]NVN40655.1 glycosyltransferase family 9 protein [Ameyamaea chiangmaiensis]GBQ63406.1 hypothetical protein AA103196_0580 [Ameyamaea chiangmaiensis NBRC 103196]
MRFVARIGAKTLFSYGARVSLKQIGWLKTGAGTPVLTGVVTFRVVAHTRHTLTEACVRADGGKRDLAQAVPIRIRTWGRAGVWAANVWVDASRLPPGRQKLHMYLYAGRRRVGHIRRFVDVRPESLSLTEFSQVTASDSFVPSSPDGDMTTDDYVLSLPVRRHRPPGRLFLGAIESILVVRADQLGDVSASLPSMMRLRRLFPEAQITMLTQKAVQPIVAASGVADDYLTLSMTYDPVTEKRFLTTQAEADIRRQLAGRTFDLAIDLSPGAESQPLMLLCAARYRVGFKPEHFPFLDFGIEVISRDKINRQPLVSHAAHVGMLISALEDALAPGQAPVTRADHGIDESILRRHGLQSKRYIVVHAGARHPINRWPLPQFLALCDKLACATEQKILLFVDADALDQASSTVCPESGGIMLMGGLDMEGFDVVVSHASLVVVNDTGPKHLASARNVPVVSISIPRLNWQEWGQNRGGIILSRHVPCAGCGLNDRRACAKDAVCVTSIPVDDVFEAAMSELGLVCGDVETID